MGINLLVINLAVEVTTLAYLSDFPKKGYVAVGKWSGNIRRSSRDFVGWVLLSEVAILFVGGTTTTTTTTCRLLDYPLNKKKLKLTSHKFTIKLIKSL